MPTVVHSHGELVGNSVQANNIPHVVHSTFYTTSKLNDLCCLLLNSRSLVPKLQEFRFLLDSAKYDVIFLTESWLGSHIPDNLVLFGLPYVLVRRDRDSLGGGILVAIKLGVDFQLTNSASDTEGLCLELTGAKVRFLLGYIPDANNGDLVFNMCSYLKKLVSKDQTNIVVGDFNMSYINWQTNTASRFLHQHFFDCVCELGLSQLVTEPTRGRNILDLILTDSDRAVFGVKVLDHFGTSDHNMVTFNVHGLNLTLSPHKPDPICKVDFTKLRELLRAVDWSSSLRLCNDVELMWTKFSAIINDCTLKSKVHSNFTGTKSKYKFCMPKKLLNCQRKKLQLWRLLKSHRNTANELKYKACQKTFSKLAHEFEISNEHRIIREGNLTALYRYVKKKTGSQRTIPPLNVNGNLVSEVREKANSLNICFAKNFVVDNGNMPNLASPCVISTCSLPTFRAKMVLDTLSSIKPSKAVGPDGFSAAFYKEIKFEVCEPLSKIFELSMQTGKVPTVWKSANIVPIYKKGDASNPGNYRPIALTCVPCKLMERSVRVSMLHFLQENNLLLQDQFGFLPGRSTVLQLLSALDDWTTYVDDGIPVDVILVDFAKAFESVSHPKLLAKLRHYGFRDILLDWLTDFLTGRHQRVRLDGCYSETVPVLSGVPQGSVLGPLLFVIYINDLGSDPKFGEIKKFADDVKLYSPTPNNDFAIKLNSLIFDIVDWSSVWQLPLAPDKCSVFHIGKQNFGFEYNLMPNFTLANSTLVKDLGVWFCTDLKPSTHCNHIVKTAFQRLAMIRKVFCSGDRATLIWAFKVYVRPIVEYASPVWSPSLVKDITRVESVQRRFTKYLPGLKGMSYVERLTELKLNSLEKRRLLADLCLTFSLLHQLIDFDYCRFFELNKRAPTRGHPWKLVPNTFKRDCRKNFFASRVVHVWNDLPMDCVLAPSLNLFKRSISELNFKKYLTGPT
jgi:hypothetical protein